MSKKYHCWRKRLSDSELRTSIDQSRTLVELGSRRLMDLESQPEPDEREIRANRVAMRAVIAHLKMLEAEAKERGL